MSLQTGIQAPEFSLPDEQGQLQNLSQYNGRWVVLYFYPKDDTPGCTTEACSFRDMNDAYKEQGIVVLGVSKDTVASHVKFTKKFKLPFTILSDTDKKVITLYEAWGKKRMFGKEYDGILRTTYIIDPQGVIKKVYEQVKPDEHAQQIIADIQALKDQES
jgi:peroxiredoxin Q/BCP